MKTVDLFYNPYTEETRLFIDKQECVPSGRRLDAFIVGKPIKSWLPSYANSYKKWSGFLPEIVDALNDDELSITFHGLRETFDEVERELERQVSALEERGYSRDCWSLCFNPHYEADVVRDRLIRFLLNRPGHNQHTMMLLDHAKERLLKTPNIAVEELIKMRPAIEQAINEAIADYASRADEKNAQSKMTSWSNALVELRVIYGGKLNANRE